MRITDELWQKAQAAERRYHTKSKEEQLVMYKDSYRQYFEHLGIDPNLERKWIIEIGCADIPALIFCTNYSHSIVIEPMPSSVLDEVTAGKPIDIHKVPVEDLDLPGVYESNQADEVWLFNVMQHIIDPDLFVEKCKKWGKVIRFFEPIDMGTNDCHPHAYTIEDFQKWFGDCVKRYVAAPNVTNFHQANCAYGTWTSK